MSTTEQVQLPPEAINILKKIIEKHSNIKLEALQKEVLDKYNSNIFFKSDQTKTLNETLVYIAKAVQGSYSNLIPYHPFNIVPTGVGPLKIIRGSSLRSEIHVWTKDKSGNDVLRSVSITDEDLAKLSQLQLFNYYKNVQLGQFSSGDFSSDHRSIFQDPSPVNIAPLQIFERLKIKRCKISESLSNVSKEEGGFPKTTDCRIVRGIIINHAKGTKVKNNVEREWAYYDIFDGSLDADFTDDEGTVLKPTLRVFVHPMWMIYENDNQIDFIGSIQVYNKGVTMQGYTLLPTYTPSGKIEGT